MRAATCRRYGPPSAVTVENVARPLPKAREVLIRVRASTVSSGDARLRGFRMPGGFGPVARLVFGISGPRLPILGTELAGEIAAVGKEVTAFQVGDPVVAFPGAAMGCHAEYKTIPATGRIIPKPEALSFDEAAAMCFGGATALHFLRDMAGIRAGDRVLIIGASGAVGSAAVQLARFFAADVTGVCSTANQDLVRSIGADRVIDYTRHDFTETGASYDIILDTVGQTPVEALKSVLAANGTLLLLVATLRQMLSASASRSSKPKIIAGPARETVEQLQFLAKLAQSGHFKPVIDSRYGLERISDAHARVDSERKTGSVVLCMAGDRPA